MAVTKQAQATSAVGTTQISREEVRQLAVNKGVREAARLLGLNEARVRKWSSRYRWFAQPESKALQERNGIVTSVTTPSDALRELLETDSKQTKIGLSKAARKAAEHLAEAAPTEVLKRSRQMKDVAGTASLVHQWESNSNAAGPIQFNVLAQRAYFQSNPQSVKE